TLLRKAFEQQRAGWRELMLMPEDYDDAALFHPLTRQLMQRIDFRHGGAEYDRKYPDGIPTTVEIEHEDLSLLSSGLVMYPEGHSRCQSGNVNDLLSHKFTVLSAMAVDDVDRLRRRYSALAEKSAAQMAMLHHFEIRGLAERVVP